MSDVLRPIDTSRGITNGAAIVNVNEQGTMQEKDPEINVVPDSGVLASRLDNRFDEYYAGGPDF